MGSIDITVTFDSWTIDSTTGQFLALLYQTKTLPKRECFGLTIGDVVEDVRTVFERLGDTSIYIPDFKSRFTTI